MDVDKYSLIL